MILTCHGSDLDCFEDGCQYEAEKPGGLPKKPFLVVTDTYGHLRTLMVCSAQQGARLVVDSE